METKLTLKLNQDVIENARKYSKAHHRSLSGLVEAYFRRLGNLNKDLPPVELSPVVKVLSGVLKESDIENWKDGYTDWLKKKYE